MKVYVTGMGVLSCLGNRVDDVMGSLLAGKTGVVAMPEPSQRVTAGLATFTPDVPPDVPTATPSASIAPRPHAQKRGR